MSSTAESTLGVKFTRLQDEVARLLGLEVPYSTEEQGDIDALVDSGLRNVYFPRGEKGIETGYNWGYLKIVKTGEVVTGGTSVFALPDDYNGGITVLHITSREGDPIPIVNQDSFRMQKVGGASATADVPVNATIYLTTPPAGTESERYSVEVYPTPTGNITLTYSYNIVPDMITSSAPCPNGSQVHGETFIAACLAVAEARQNKGDARPFYEEFIKRLAGSIELDRNANRQLPGSTMHSATAVALTTFASDYNHLVTTIGGETGLGFNLAMYSWDQLQTIQRVIDRGVAKFYWPVLRDTHVWTFMKPWTTLATVAETEDYDLPINTGTVLGDMFIDSDEPVTRIQSTTLDRLMNLRHNSNLNTGIPSLYATRPKGSDGTAEQVMEILFWPKPDKVYTLHYRFQIRPNKISTSEMYTLAGPEHGETILLACLMLLEEDVNGSRHQEYKEALESSVNHDASETAMKPPGFKNLRHSFKPLSNPIL